MDRTEQKESSLKDLFDGREKELQAISETIHTTAWAACCLEDIRDKIGENLVVDDGRKKTCKVNPLLRTYTEVWKIYIVGIGKILEVSGKEKDGIPIALEKPKTMLEIIRKKSETA